MKTASLKIALTVGALGLFTLSCWVWWAGHGGITNLCIAEATWCALAIGVARLWFPRRRAALAVLIGAVVTLLVWSRVMVDFQPHWVEHGPLFVPLGLLFLPLMVSALVGYQVRNGGSWAAALAFGLGAIGLLPVQIWNEERGVAGGWKEYGFDPSRYALFLAVCAGVAAGSGWLGSRLPRRWSPSATEHAADGAG
jgi:peptidoglycan/LPS O-acetylase OafA/YrhL